MRLSIREVARFVAGLATSGRSVLVGIDGCAGSGKTTFAHRLASGLGDSPQPVSVVHTDLIYRPVADRWQGHIDDMPVGYDLDWERLRDEVIEPLRAGRTARFQLYDWTADRLSDWVRIDAGGITIIDGVFAIRRELTDCYDLRIWFSCPREVREPRLLGRGDTSRAELDYWFPIEERYLAAQMPEQSAHLVIDGAPEIAADGGSGPIEVLRWSPAGAA